MKLGRAWFGLGLLATMSSALVSGCVVEIIDPVGSDASIEGAWTIEGAAASAETCAAAGITHVRVRVWDGDTYFDPAELVFPCDAGSFDTVDPVLRDGGWSLQLLALDNTSASVVVSEGPREYFDTLAEGGHITMSSVDFMGATGVTAMQASWTINGATPTEANCAELGIDEVLVEIVTGPSGAGTTLKAMCADGTLYAEIDPGNYDIRVVASNLDTGEISSTEFTETFMVENGATYVINGGPIDYVGGFSPLGTDAALTSSWTIGGVTAGEKSCEAVLGSTVDIVFYAADDTTFENGIVVASGSACADGVYDSVDAVLAAGDYLVAAELLDSTGGLISRSETASAFTVAAGTPVAVDVDFRLDSATMHAFLEWQDPETDADVDCATAGVGDMHWELWRLDAAGDEFIAGQDVGMNIACADFVNVMGDTAGGMLPAGDYELFLEGYVGTGASATKAWDRRGSCTTTIDGDGGLGLMTCQTDYVPPA